MIYRIGEKVLHDFPQTFRGVVIATQINNTTGNFTALEEMLISKCKDIQINDQIDISHPRIQKWFDVYKQNKINTKENLPSIAALVKRIKQGKIISFISPIVSIINIISLTYLVPSGGIDTKKIKGDLILDKAAGDEHFIPFGKDKSIQLMPGEIIFYDSFQKNVICRAWNSKAGQLTIISPETNSVVIDIDGMRDVIPEEEIVKATEHLASLISEFCAGNTRIEYLNQDRNEFMI